MAREGEPRVTVRFDRVQWARVSAAAAAADVAVAALVRECALRYATSVAREVSEGGLRMRRRSLPVPVPAAAAPPEEERPFGGGEDEAPWWASEAAANGPLAEYVEPSRFGVLAAAASSAATVLVFEEALAAVLEPRDVLLVTPTGEMLLVEAVNGALVTVRRDIARNAAAPIERDAEVLIVGRAEPCG